MLLLMTTKRNIMVPAAIFKQVEVDPLDVITTLLNNAGRRAVKEGNKFYILQEIGVGAHSYTEKKEITEKHYNYCIALWIVYDELLDHK
jgi:hypothetical protein